MNKKSVIILIVVALVLVGAIIAFVVNDANNKKQEEKNKSSDERDRAALKLINDACDNLIDADGNYNLGGKETEVVCEKGFCHINYQGENYGFNCNE
jgi:hypothetical protein